MLAWSVALAFLALAGGQSVYLSAAAMFILGLTGAIGNVEFGAYLVRSVADDMVARVTGIGQMLAIGACALGPVLGGYAIQQLQVQGAILILLAIVLSLAFISLLLPEASNKIGRDHPGTWTIHPERPTCVWHQYQDAQGCSSALVPCRFPARSGW